MNLLRGPIPGTLTSTMADAVWPADKGSHAPPEAPSDCDLSPTECRSLGRFRAVGYYHLHRALRSRVPLAIVALPTSGGSRYSRKSAFAQCLRNE
jgi:hypothetical protein